MGYLDRNLENQKSFTPRNRKVAGRAYPDMFGTVIWANIIAMILNNDYIRELFTAEEFIIALLACLACLLSWSYGEGFNIKTRVG